MAIYAWRYWSGCSTESMICPKYMLFGMYGVYWSNTKLPHKAVCQGHSEVSKHYDSSEAAPGIGGQCGIYALKQPSTADPYTGWSECQKQQFQSILGVVELWGKIIVAKHGYRAEYAQLRALVQAPEQAAAVYQLPNLPSVEYAKKEYFE